MIKGSVVLASCFMMLSGCAVPLVMGANLAAGEAFTVASKPKVEVTGADIYRMANWNKRFDRKTASLFGNRDWSCARGAPGTTICVPKSEATQASVSRNVIFNCTYGSGGMMTNMVSQDAGIMFCRKA